MNGKRRPHKIGIMAGTNQLPARSASRISLHASRITHHAPRSLQAQLRKVKLFLCDVDGVLTNGSVLLGEGKEFKTFNIQDGLGLLLLKRHGIKVGWISSRPSAVTKQRAEELKIDFLHQENGSKVEAVQAILASTGSNWEDICY